MKSWFIVLLLVGSVFTGEAQSMLKVHMVDNSPVNVSLDGRYFNKRGSSITVGDLPPGRHILRIFMVEPGRRGRGHEDVIYEGKVKTHEGMVTIFQYDPNTQAVQEDEQDINQYLNEHPAVAQQRADRTNRDYDNGQYSNQYDNQSSDNQGNGQYNTPPPTPTPTATLNDSKMDNLKTNVIAKATDVERTKIMEDGLKGETFTTDQVSRMMDWFSFESSKVDFAEWAYPNTVDKSMFYNVESKLTYQNYRDDIDKFLKTR